MFDRFTEAARISVLLARYEAARGGAVQLAPGHLLLALLNFQWRLFAPFFQSRASAAPLCADVESECPKAEWSEASWDVPMSREAKRALGFAADEAARLRHKHIDTSHLLLGILREEQSSVARLLRQYGVEAAAVRERAVTEWREEQRGWTWTGCDLDS